jgi:hypothetical protein
LNDFDLSGVLTPLPEEAPVASSLDSSLTFVSDKTPIPSSSNQDHEMEDNLTNPASIETSVAEPSTAPKNAIKFKKTKKAQEMPQATSGGRV